MANKHMKRYSTSLIIQFSSVQFISVQGQGAEDRSSPQASQCPPAWSRAALPVSEIMQRQGGPAAGWRHKANYSLSRVPVTNDD